jgi:L-2-amino-thiazoline-4-carboxylic acid hydrolase
MEPEKPRLTLLHQREIEARVVGPLIRAFAAELGMERTLAVVRDVIRTLALEGGRDLARAIGEHSLEAFAQSLDRWREDDALEIEILEQSASRLSFNVTRCRYAEMYRALGLADLGASLSCQRDYELAQGFNPDIKLERTQTIMQGASHCDFRFQLATHPTQSSHEHSTRSDTALAREQSNDSAKRAEPPRPSDDAL